MTVNFMDEETKKLLEKNLEYSQEIYRQTKYIKNYVFWAQIASVIKILLIAVPIIIGIIYLPPLLKGAFDQYKDILGIQAGTTNPIQGLLNSASGGLNLENIDINKLPPQVKALLNK